MAYFTYTFLKTKKDCFVISIIIFLTMHLEDSLSLSLMCMISFSPYIYPSHFLRLSSITLYECTTIYLYFFDGHYFCYYKYDEMKIPRHTCATISAKLIPKSGIFGPNFWYTFKVLIDVAKLPSKN